MDISRLSPEQQQALLTQLVALSTSDEEAAGFDEQLQQARALQQPSGQRYTTAAGGILGGFGDVVRTLYGNQQAAEAKKGREGLGERRRKAREEYGKQLFGGMQSPSLMTADGPPLEEATPFGYGGG